MNFNNLLNIRTMKKILLFMLPIMAFNLASCEKNKGNNDELSGDDVIEFKDPNFLKALLTVQSIRKYDERIDYLVDVDANKDGAITVNEAQEVKALRLSYVDSSNFNLLVSFNVVEMPEIKYFTSLTYLDCYDNLLTSLDVSNNAALTYLDCGRNGLSSLDLSNNTALTYLNCYDNLLTSLDVSNNAALTDLSCSYNQLTSLDLSNNTALESLNCGENLLTSLDVSNNAALTDLSCGSNQLTSLDLSNNAALESLYCYGNQLTSLDLSKNRALWYFGPVLVWFTNGNIIYDMDISTACPLESLMLYKYHQLSANSMEILETVYPELEITYVE